MLTMVVEGRQPLLGRVLSSASSPATTSPALAPATTPCASAQGIQAHVELTALGRAIRDEETPKISTIFPMVEVWKLCIMPDHIHIIVRVKEDMPERKHLGQVVAGFKGGCSRAWWRLMPCTNVQGVVATTSPVSTTTSPVSTTPPPASAATTPAASAAGKNPPLFEPGYNDQILLDDGQLENWKHYLDDNPRRLAIKRLHPTTSSPPTTLTSPSGIVRLSAIASCSTFRRRCRLSSIVPIPTRTMPNTSSDGWHVARPAAYW